MRNKTFSTSIAVLAFIFPMAALADVTGTTTLQSGQHFGLDAGTTSSSGGDLAFTGTSITLQGTATAYAAGALGASDYSAFTQSVLSEFASLFTPTAISGGSLVANEVIGVHTNGGNYSKILITAVSSTSLTFQYDTFESGTGGGAGGPSIVAIQNNYSNIVVGQPNYGIAPGTLFNIYGSGLSSQATYNGTQNSGGSGLPTSLNGATVSVTVGGVTTHPAFYFALATQLAVVLPSATPVGTGTLTVSYGGQSATAPIYVVQSALGLDTLYGTGTGLGVVTLNNSATVFNYNNSAAPGQVIVLWGSGLGADTADSDTVFTSTPHAVNVPLQVYIGGILASIAYQGASGYPGVNQIDVTIPAGVQPGCGVSIVAVSEIGNIVSNTITIPVTATAGGVCSDPTLGYTGSEILTLGGKTSYNSGSLDLFQITSSSGVESLAAGDFYNYQGQQSSSGVGLVSLGNCIVGAATTQTSTTSTFTETGLDAGTLTLTGPSGTVVSLPEIPSLLGTYEAELPAGFLTSGAYLFTGTGGTTPGVSVGAFKVTVNFNNAVVWTNRSSISSVTRSQGQTFTWTGGAPNSYVYMEGSSSDSTTGVFVSFTCYAPSSAGTFTVPSYVLLALPAGSGSLALAGLTTLQTFTATGIDQGTALGFSESSVDTIPFN
jgi:uncharacterized protein (TIGR03437 family)